MLQYSRILRLKEEGFSLRSIASSTGNSRQKVTEVIERAERKGLKEPLDEDVTDKWLEEFLFPEKSLKASGRQPIDFDHIHKELAKPNVTLSLLHHEYETECRVNKKIPYSYRSFVRHYSSYANKHKATLRISAANQEKSWKLTGPVPPPSSLTGTQVKKRKPIFSWRPCRAASCLMRKPVCP
ncbi:transposase [Fictibacillus terranigra]|uniref:transposase n=1 Tax=Fictibacillus terranigra TaxID=3058424 RepID=UPI00338E4F84